MLRYRLVNAHAPEPRRHCHGFAATTVKQICRDRYRCCLPHRSRCVTRHTTTCRSVARHNLKRLPPLGPISRRSQRRTSPYGSALGRLILAVSPLLIRHR